MSDKIINKKQIHGYIEFGGKKYNSSLINDILQINIDVFEQKIVASFLNNWIELIPNFHHHDRSYFLYISHKQGIYDGFISFKIKFCWTNFYDEKNTSICIESKGLINSFNDSDNVDDRLEHIGDYLNKEIFNVDLTIRNTKFNVICENIGLFVKNNLYPFSFSTRLKFSLLEKNINIQSFSDIFDFSIKLLQFITLNTYAIIDRTYVLNNKGGYSEIEIYEEYNDVDNSNDCYLFCLLSNDELIKLLGCFPDSISRQYNLYHYKKEWVYEFDIVRMSGTFEDIFRQFVEKDTEYKKELENRKNEIHYKELKDIFKNFSNTYDLQDNDDFSLARSLFDNYGGTLKNKLAYILDDFCKTMDFIIIDMGLAYFYNPSDFDNRIKDARNAICHGLHSKDIDWKNVANDTLVLQELNYYMILKYQAKLSQESIKKCIEKSFDILNKNAFFRKDDPRIKWKDE